MSNACRIATSHTIKLAEEVFNNDVALAWAVIPFFMEKNNITDESTIIIEQLKEFWNNQQDRQQKVLKIKRIPYKTIINEKDFDGTIGASRVGDEIVYNTVQGITKHQYMQRWYSQQEELFNLPNVLQKITAPSDILWFELSKQKYDLAYGVSKSDIEKMQLALNDMDFVHEIHGTPSVNYYVESNPDVLEGRLSFVSDTDNTIHIKNNISVEEFFNYITGNDNSQTSELQKAVIDKLANDYNITLSDLKEIINNPFMVRHFLYLSGFNRAQHREDKTNFNNEELLDPVNIAINTRTILYALGYITGKGYTYPNINQLLIERERARLAQESEAQEVVNNPKNFHGYSGFSNRDYAGSDKYWMDIAAQYGVPFDNFTNESLDNLSPEERQINEDEYSRVADFLHRPKLDLNNGGVWTRRDMLQANAADAVFAIGSIVPPKSRGSKYLNQSSYYVVDGGTGYAVMKAQLDGKPTYVFNLVDNKWYKSTGIGTFVQTETPTLTNNFAGIGTRNLNDAGRQAIQDVYEKTFGKNNTSQSTTSSIKESEYYQQFNNALNALIDKVNEYINAPNVDDTHKKAAQSVLNLYNYTRDANNVIIEAIIKGEREDKNIDKSKLTEKIEGLNSKIPSELSDGLLDTLRSISKEWGNINNTPSRPTNTTPSQQTVQDDDFEDMLGSMENQTLSTSQEQSPGEQLIDESSYQLPEIDSSMIQADTDSPLYRMSLQMDVTQINNRVNMISHRISEGITKAIEGPRGLKKTLLAKMNNGEATDSEIELFGKLFDEEEGRKAAIPFIINDVLKEVKRDIQENYNDMKDKTPEQIEDEFGYPNPEYIRDQYRILIENYEDLFDMACDDLENTEQVVLTRTSEKVKVNKSVSDQQMDDSQLDDADDGKRATGNEGYSFSARMIDPHMSSRAVTRRILSGLHQVNYKGQFETDDLGEMIFVPESVAYSSLINDLTKVVHHPEDFNVRHEDGTYSYPALEGLVKKYPWVKEILNKLYKNPTLGSALYTDLCKEYVQYWTQYNAEVTDSKGKVTIERQTKRANAPVARQSIMDKINASYNEHAVTTESMLWNKEGSIVEDNANDIKERTNVIIKSLNEGSIPSEFVEELSDILNSIGVDTNPDEIGKLIDDSTDSKDKVISLANNIAVIATNAINLDVNNSLVNEYRGSYENIADIIGIVNELHNAITFRQGEADFPSYTTPNYITFIKNGIQDKKNWNKFLMDEFAYDDFLYDKDKQEFKSYWLELLRSDKEVRNAFDIKYVNVIDGKEYADWTHDEIIKNYIFEYNSVPIGSGKQYAYYSFPIFSDSTIASFVKMPRFIRNFKNEVTERLVGLAKQEISRIKKVKMRAIAGASQIQRFDAVGDKFLFMPELNDYTIEGVNLLDYINSLPSDNIAEADRVLTQAVNEIMQANADDFWNNNRELFKDKFTSKDDNGNPIIDPKLEAQTKKGIEEFYWNNALAQSQIIQLMTTDLAYYKDYTDFQKRFKEVYASGARLNTQSKYGRKIERTLYLADVLITSPSYDGLKTSLLDAYGKGLISEDEMLNILDKAKNINAVDAQAYRTLSSYRAVLDMQGKWTPAMESAFDRFSRGEWSNEDFSLVWGVIKPFLFANIKTSDGVGGYQRVPHQNKNSEFLLLAFLNGFELGNKMRNSPKLRGLNRAMEDFQIDVAMFQSAVKAGGQGIVDISYSREKLNAWKNKNADLGVETYEDYKKLMDSQLEDGLISQEEYNKAINDMSPSEDEVYEIIRSAIYDKTENNKTDLFEQSEETGKIENKNVIHEIPYEHYMIAQPTVNHLVDAESVFGSQFRNLIKSDLPDDFEITINNKTYKAKNEQGVNEIAELYDSLLVENLLDNWEEVTELFGDIETLQKRLMGMVKGNPSYGPDILNALQLVTIDGKTQFNIPPHNTTIANKIEQLILSVFKNSITKQHIKGAACVLVSSFGFDKDLKIHRDANGAITAFECYMPAHTEILFKDFLVPIKDKDGKIIGQEIDMKRVPKELLEGIGFRIPTEAKYSMSNIIIKGFLPQQNGACLMLPAETTMLAGEDYDKLTML